MYAEMTRERPAEAAGANRIVDLRSDTVTRPTPEMRAAMASAEVGDDVFGDDPTVLALQDKASRLLGKEAALFLPSGTQSNLAAVLSHCGRGDEIIIGREYHIFCHEAGGAAVLGGISPFPIPTGPDGGVDPADVTAAIKADDPHYPVSRLLCLENIVSGRVVPLDRLAAAAAAGRAAGLAMHLDGARLFNAAVALGVPAAELAAVADTVSICLSKGLGTPAGTVLVGPADLIARTHRMRKILGGAMRQVGVLAACGLHALEHNVARLAEDHRRARQLAEGLAAIPQLEVDLDRVQTNMLFVTPPPEQVSPLRGFLAERGVLIGGQSPSARLVTHLDITDEDVDRTLDGYQAYFTG